MIKKTLVAAAALAVLATGAQASTQGTLSQTSSTGTTVVTANIPNMVSISGLTDVIFNVTAADINNPHFGGIDETSAFCVYSNVTAGGNYNISVGSSVVGAGNTFALSGNGATLPMAVWVSDEASNGFGANGDGFTWPGHIKTNYSTAQTGQPRATDLSCSNVSGGKNAALQLRITDAALLAAVAGAYSGTLTLTVSVP